MSHLQDLAAFVVVACAWGLTFAVVEVGLESFPPLLLMALRYDVAGVVLLGYVIAQSEIWKPTTRSDLFAIAGGGIFWIAVGNGIWFVGQELTSSVLSGIMTSLAPIATTVLSWAIIPEDRLSPTGILGIFVCFIGAILIVWPSEMSVLSAGFLGEVLLLVGVLGAALGSVLIRWTSTSLANSALTAWAVIIGGGIIHLLSYAANEPLVATTNPYSIGALLYLSLIATVIAYQLYFSLLGRYTAIEVTLITYLVPIVAIIAGALFFNEHVTPRILAGFVVVIAGFVLLKWKAIQSQVGR